MEKKINKFYGLGILYFLLNTINTEAQNQFDCSAQTPPIRRLCYQLQVI